MENPWVLILVMTAIAAAAGAMAWLSWQARKKRREELAGLARHLGWSFDPLHDRRHDQQYAQFEIFRRGHSRAAYNTLQGTLEVAGAPWPARMGDYTYKVTRYTGKTVQTTTYRFSYLIIHLPAPGLPALFIRPENVLDKIAGALGFDDIDFESAEFSRKFYVKALDKRYEEFFDMLRKTGWYLGPALVIDVSKIDFVSNVRHLIAVFEAIEQLLVPKDFKIH